MPQVNITPEGQLSASLSSELYFDCKLSADTVLTAKVDFAENVIPANTVFTYKGVAATSGDLPNDASYGDAYSVTSESSYFAWNGEEWIDIGEATMYEELTAGQIEELQGLLD